MLILAFALPSQAAVRVLATTADWGALTKELGGDRVDVYTATTAMQDVHRVEAKPSLVARARTADLLVANGAELEAGWLPVLLQESGNGRIQRGAPGFFEAASAVALVEVPTQARSRDGRHPPARQSAHPPRSAQRGRGREGARRKARRRRSGRSEPTRRAAPISTGAGARRWRAGRRKRRRSRTCRS